MPEVGLVKDGGSRLLAMPLGKKLGSKVVFGLMVKPMSSD